MSDDIDKKSTVKEIKSVTIIDTAIPIIEYKRQRVITLATMDKIHHRPDGTARRNFNEHKDRLEKDKHYFHLNYQEVKSLYEISTSGIEPNSKWLVVLTERGYSMLVKSFTDDFAWEVQDQLVDTYFDSKKPMSTAEFLVQQAQLILEHENRIKRLEKRQDSTEVHLAETRHEVELIHQKANKAFEFVAAVINYKHGEPDYYTVAGFCNKHKIKLQGEEPKMRDLQATHESRGMGKDVIKIPDDRWVG